MSAEVDICNLALALLGDEATVSSIYPPDGSAQAAHCARFYPIARDALLEMHTWGFATTRVALALTTSITSAWQYAYSPPSNVLNYLEILDPAVVDEYTVGVQSANTSLGASNIGIGNYVPQAYEIEKDAQGNSVLLTNLPNAVLRYTMSVNDPTKFSPLFTEALSALLASKLAGPMLKGAAGRAAAQDMMKLFAGWMAKATESDANDRRLRLTLGAPWMVNR